MNQQIKQRQRELSKLPNGIVHNRRSTINFRLPDTPPSTLQEQDKYWPDVEENWVGTPVSTISGPPAPIQPTSLFDYDRDFPPLSKHILAKSLLPINQSRETSSLSPEGSSSPLRNKLPNIVPLPSRPSVDNFSRPITEITDEKNNTISITPKKPVLPPIGLRQLSQQLQKSFPDVDSTIEKTSETFKERSEDIDELIKKLGETDENADQVTFEFEFFTGGKNQKFDLFIRKYGLTNENMLFVDFY